MAFAILDPLKKPVEFLFGRTASKSSIVLYGSTLTLLAGIPAFTVIYHDYQRYLAMGPGGIPNTFPGYLLATTFRLFYAHGDPLWPPTLAGSFYPRKGLLSSSLKTRSSPRPRTDGIAPHRQMEQHASSQVQNLLKQAVLNLVTENPGILHTDISAFEKHGLGVFCAPATAAKDPDAPPHAAKSHLNPTCRDTGEVTHIHDSDSSMHLTLHPLDSAIVIANGWGQRHPMAGVPVLGKSLVPAGFTMVYAPQNEEEVETVMRIVRAAIWWVGGVDLS